MLSKKKRAIVSAIYGSYDPLRTPVVQSTDVDFIMFTDNPHLESNVWNIRYAPVNVGHPRMCAKWFKLQQHVWLPNYQETIWIDGDMEITDPDFAKKCFEHLGDEGFTTIQFWLGRDCIYQEWEACRTLDKYKDTLGSDQVSYYISRGMPEHYGLYACTTLIQRIQDERVKKLSNAWWYENLRWSYMDQVSLPFVCWQQNFKPATMPYETWRPCFNLHHHNIGS